MREALASNAPVVALESTIVAHGMPYPENLRTALEVEATVRAAGAIPATCAVVDGVPRVGLTRDELEKIARMGSACVKASRRDLGVACGGGKTGGDDGERDDGFSARLASMSSSREASEACTREDRIPWT